MSDYTCPSCDSPLSEEDQYSGPDAPEVGWEYYECPNCGGRSHPQLVEDSPSSNKVTYDGTFTGVVVEVSPDFVLIDNEQEVVECRGLSESVTLADKITVKFEKSIQKRHYASKTLLRCSVIIKH